MTFFFSIRDNLSDCNQLFLQRRLLDAALALLILRGLSSTWWESALSPSHSFVSLVLCALWPRACFHHKLISQCFALWNTARCKSLQLRSWLALTADLSFFSSTAFFIIRIVLLWEIFLILVVFHLLTINRNFLLYNTIFNNNDELTNSLLIIAVSFFFKVNIYAVIKGSLRMSLLKKII